MSSNRKSPSSNQNWIETERLNDYKKQAKAKVSETNKQNEGKTQVTIPHPTLKKTFILKYI